MRDRPCVEVPKDDNSSSAGVFQNADMFPDVLGISLCEEISFIVCLPRREHGDSRTVDSEALRQATDDAHRVARD